MFVRLLPVIFPTCFCSDYSTVPAISQENLLDPQETIVTIPAEIVSAETPSIVPRFVYPKDFNQIENLLAPGAIETITEIFIEIDPFTKSVVRLKALFDEPRIRSRLTSPEPTLILRLAIYERIQIEAFIKDTDLMSFQETSFFITTKQFQVVEFFYPKEKQKLLDFLSDENLPRDAFTKLKIYYAKNYDSIEMFNDCVSHDNIKELNDIFNPGNFFSRTPRFPNFEVTIIGRFSKMLLRRNFPRFKFQNIQEITLNELELSGNLLTNKFISIVGYEKTSILVYDDTLYYFGDLSIFRFTFVIPSNIRSLKLKFNYMYPWLFVGRLEIPRSISFVDIESIFPLTIIVTEKLESLNILSGNVDICRDCNVSHLIRHNSLLGSMKSSNHVKSFTFNCENIDMNSYSRLILAKFPNIEQTKIVSSIKKSNHRFTDMSIYSIWDISVSIEGNIKTLNLTRKYIAAWVAAAGNRSEVLKNLFKFYKVEKHFIH
jgi:hypothetical protein